MPTIVDAIRQLRSITLRHLGVGTLDASMDVGVIASASNVLEAICVAANGPRLSEWNTPRAC